MFELPFDNSLLFLIMPLGQDLLLWYFLCGFTLLDVGIVSNGFVGPIFFFSCVAVIYWVGLGAWLNFVAVWILGACGDEFP